MTELDDTMVPLALSLIDELGKDMTWTPPSGTYTPGAGGLSGVSPSPFSRKASPPSPYEKSWATGALIQAGRSIVFLADSGLTPKPAPGWVVEIDSDTWKVTRADAIYSGELVAVWEVELAR
jgi:hypothetical protein